MVKREARIALLTQQLEQALEDRKATAIARIEAEGLMQSTIRVFHGLAICMRQSLGTLGLDPHAISAAD
jgi:hypothetical protein